MTLQPPTNWNPLEGIDETLASIDEARDEHTSKGIFQHLVRNITEFERSVSDTHEVSAILASFGQPVLLHVNHVSFIYPKLIIFKGMTENRDNATLIQHFNQLNFLLVKVKRLTPGTQKTPIGFGPWTN